MRLGNDELQVNNYLQRRNKLQCCSWIMRMCWSKKILGKYCQILLILRS